MCRRDAKNAMLKEARRSSGFNTSASAGHRSDPRGPNHRFSQLAFSLSLQVSVLVLLPIHLGCIARILRLGLADVRLLEPPIRSIKKVVVRAVHLTPLASAFGVSALPILSANCSFFG